MDCFDTILAYTSCKPNFYETSNSKFQNSISEIRENVKLRLQFLYVPGLVNL